MALAASSAKYNDIQLAVFPDPRYERTSYCTDKNINKASREVIIDSWRIKELQIRKSYRDATTSIVLQLTEIDHTTAARLAEGKYILGVGISASMAREDTGPTSVGHFYVADTDFDGNTTTIGLYPTVSITLHLKSIILQRLQLENNLSFELGGKGPSGSIVQGVDPYTFFTTAVKGKYIRTYLPNNDLIGGFDLTQFISENSPLKVKGHPDMGYKIEADNNFDALQFIMDVYPMTTSPFGWMIDDMAVHSNLQTSTSLTIKDFLDFRSWFNGDPDHIDMTFSGLIANSSELMDVAGVHIGGASGRDVESGLGSDKVNIEYTPSSDPKKTTPNDLIDMVRIFDFRPVDAGAAFNIGRFMISDLTPKIYAERVSDGSITMMTDWNKQYATAKVPVSNHSSLELKDIPNPMYRKYVTFMPAAEIAKCQNNLNAFNSMHPEFKTYSLTNLWYGEIDTHTTIAFPQATLVDDEKYLVPSTSGQEDYYDRIGTTFELTHTFNRISGTDATLERKRIESGVPPDEQAFNLPQFRLTTEVTMLILDAKEYLHTNDTSGYFIDANNNNLPNDLGLLSATCEKDGVLSLPEGDPNTPGNGDILANAWEMYNRGFRYSLNGAQNLNQMNCSHFVGWAVRKAGIKNFPTYTLSQLSTLNKMVAAGEAVRIGSKADIQAGDILFFHGSAGANRHVGIAISNTEYIESNHYRSRDPDRGNWRNSFARKKIYNIFRIPKVTT